jgi:GDP-L-fucose synthase
MSFWEGKKVLVTGAAGIAGQSTVRRLLSEGAIVRAIVGNNRKLEVEHPHLTTYKHNLLIYDDCLNVTKNVDVVINLAAVIKGAKGQKTGQLELVRENVIIGVNMITAAVENGVKRFGFVGSSTMYPPYNFVTEDDGFREDPWEGYLGVGNMKRYLEKVCMQFHKQSNTKFAIARTTALYGPYDTYDLDKCHVIPALINKICNKQNPLEVWGDGSEQRNFIYVEDFVDGLLYMVENYCEADPINITNSEISTVNDVIKYATEHVGYTPAITYDKTKPTMIPTRIVNTTKAERILNWKAKTSLKEGINKTIDWYKDHYKIKN